MNQLSLFPQTVRKIKLTADTKRKAFYRLKIMDLNGNYYIEKQSGYGEVILDKRVWEMATLRDAILFFNRKVNQKVKPRKGNPRVYKEAG